MVPPPYYYDLGKSAKDLFEKGFNYGFANGSLKTKTESGMEFTTKLTSSNDTGKIEGALETKYSQPKYGLTLTEKWTTDNKLATDVAIEDQIATGLTTTLCTRFLPNSGKKWGALKAVYKRDYIHAKISTDLKFAGPETHGAAVVGYEGWLAGYKFCFASSKSALTQNEFTVGYNNAELQTLLQVWRHVDRIIYFNGYLFQKVSDNLSVAWRLQFAAGKKIPFFGVASKYSLGPDASISTKADSLGRLGCGYSHSLSKGVKLTLSALIDGKNLNSGGHKVGVGIEFEV